MSKIVEMEKEIKKVGISDLYAVLKDTIDLLHFSLLYIRNDICENDNDRNKCLLQMNCISNEISMFVEKLVMKDIEKKLFTDIDIETAFKILVLKSCNNEIQDKKNESIFEKNLSEEQFSKVLKEFEEITLKKEN